MASSTCEMNTLNTIVEVLQVPRVVLSWLAILYNGYRCEHFRAAEPMQEADWHLHTRLIIKPSSFQRPSNRGEASDPGHTSEAKGGLIRGLE